MPHSLPQNCPGGRSPLQNNFYVLGLIVLCALAAYHNSFSSPLLFDDKPAIIDNPTIRHLWPVWESFTPSAQKGSGVYGRPLINFSLALNYAIGGTNVRGYHVFNFVIHLLAGLTLFGLVRRTLCLPRLQDRFGRDASPIAGVIALLWTIHPLLTESVSSVIQRTESLMGTLYLLTLYGFIRALEPSHRTFWRIFTFVACLLGMLSKEVMVSAPLIALLYDRTFVTGSFGDAWRQRKNFYASLASTWLVLTWLVFNTHGDRGGTCGLNGAATPWTYALTQCEAIIRYVRLSFWPYPLVFDYGSHLVTRMTDVLAQGLALVALIGGTFFALWRRPPIGFLGACFFMILAPSSSIVPLVTQTMAEHRMYLPLAAIITLVVIGAYWWFGRRVIVGGFIVAIPLIMTTSLRNQDYATGFSIWADTVNKWPTCARAHNNLGGILIAAGRNEEALAHFNDAIRLAPEMANAHFNRGIALLALNRKTEAIASFEDELRIKPEHPTAPFRLGSTLVEIGKPADALPHLETAAQLAPNDAATQYYLGDALAALDRPTDALAHYEQALRLQPDYAEAYCALADMLVRLGKINEACSQYEKALSLNPTYADAHNNFGNALLQLDRPVEAVAQYEKALQAEPSLVNAHCNLGIVLVELHRLKEAAAHFRTALQLEPDNPSAKEMLARLAQPTLSNGAASADPQITPP